MDPTRPEKKKEEKEMTSKAKRQPQLARVWARGE